MQVFAGSSFLQRMLRSCFMSVFNLPGYVWTGENDFNTVTCGRGTFRNRENIYPVLNLHGYMWTGPKSGKDFLGNF